jgi:hypothetical protein
VLVRAVLQPSDQQSVDSLFAPILQAVAKPYVAYSDNQLRIVADFMTRMSGLIREQIAGLQHGRAMRCQ